MWTKFLSKLACFVSSKSHTSKVITSTHALHDWKRQMSLNREKRKIIPRLIYLHNPWKYFLAKFSLFKLRILWDPSFVESEFVRGAKQAAVVLTNVIRNQNTLDIKQFATPVGYQQITRDMLLSRDDRRLQLVRFEPEHLRRAILMKVVTKQHNGRRFCFIDMLFVGLRNTKDFDTAEEAVEIRDVLHKLDADSNSPSEMSTAPHRIVFAEIFIRFRRNYTKYPEHFTLEDKTDDDDRDWSVAFYKILTFDVLNYETRDQD